MENSSSEKDNSSPIQIPSTYFGTPLSPKHSELEEQLLSLSPNLIGQAEDSKEHLENLDGAIRNFFEDPIHDETNDPAHIAKFCENPKKLVQIFAIALMSAIYSVSVGKSFQPLNLNKSSTTSNKEGTPSICKKRPTPKTPLSPEYIEKCLPKIQQYAQILLTTKNAQIQYETILKFVQEFSQFSDKNFSQDPNLSECNSGQCLLAYKSDSEDWKSYISQVPEKFQKLLTDTIKYIIFLPNIIDKKRGKVEGKVYPQSTIAILHQSQIPSLGTALHEAQHIENQSKKITYLENEMSAFTTELEYYQTVSSSLNSKGLFIPALEASIVEIKLLLKQGEYLKKRGLNELYPSPETTADELIKYLDQSKITKLASEKAHINRRRDQKIKIAAQIALHYFEIPDPFKLKEFLEKKYLNNPHSSKTHRNNAAALIKHLFPFLFKTADKKKRDYTPQKLNSRKISQARRQARKINSNKFLESNLSGQHAPPNLNSPNTIQNLSASVRDFLLKRPGYSKKHPNSLKQSNLDNVSRKIQMRIDLPPIVSYPKFPTDFNELSKEDQSSTNQLLAKTVGYSQTLKLSDNSTGKTTTIESPANTSLKKLIDQLPSQPVETRLDTKAIRSNFHITVSDSTANSRQREIVLPTASAFNGKEDITQLTQNIVLRINKVKADLWSHSRSPERKTKARNWSLAILNEPKARANPYITMEAYKLYAAATFQENPQSTIETIRKLFAPESLGSDPRQPAIRFFSDHPDQTFYSHQNQTEDFIIGVEVLTDLAKNVSKSPRFPISQKFQTLLTILAIIDDLSKALGANPEELLKKIYNRPAIHTDQNRKGIQLQQIYIHHGEANYLSIWRENRNTISQFLHLEQDRPINQPKNLKLIQQTTDMQNTDYLLRLLFSSMGEIYQIIEQLAVGPQGTPKSLYISEQFTKRSDFPLLRPSHHSSKQHWTPKRDSY